MGFGESYKREESTHTHLTEGDYRCVIVGTTEKISKNGTPMVEIVVNVSGSSAKLKAWLVQNEYFNENATKFFDAFPTIKEGDFNLLGWIGAEGGCHLRKQKDSEYMEIGYWLYPDKTEALPPFVGKKPEQQTVTNIAAATADDDDDLPF